MQTLDSFIVERLKINKDTKIEKPYNLFVIPYGENYELVDTAYDEHKHTKKIISVFFYNLQTYIVNKDFFETELLKFYKDYSSSSHLTHEHLDTIVKVPIDLDKKELLEKYRDNNAFENDEHFINQIRKDFEIYRINK